MKLAKICFVRRAQYSMGEVGLRLSGYTVVLGLLAVGVMLFPRVVPAKQSYGEGHVLEWLQFTLLLLSAIVLAWAGYRYRRHWSLSFVMACLLIGACIRESDSLLDRYMFAQSWETGVIAAVIAAGIVAVWKFKRLMVCLRQLSNSASFGIMFSGFLVVMVFSRILGHNDFWDHIMGSSDRRMVVRTVEENIELLGYFLILVGVVEYAFTLRLVSRGKLQAAVRPLAHGAVTVPASLNQVATANDRRGHRDLSYFEDTVEKESSPAASSVTSDSSWGL